MLGHFKEPTMNFHLDKKTESYQSNGVDNNSEISTQGHFTDTTNEMVTAKETMTDTKDNTHASFLYKKTERVTTALYLITNLLDNNEPLKWQLRERGLALLSLVLTFTNGIVPARIDRHYEILTRINELLSLLEVAHLSGNISEMNFTVLRREYGLIITLFGEKERIGDIARGGMLLANSFFDVPQPNKTNKTQLARDTDQNKIVNDGNQNVGTQSIQSHIKSHNQSIKRHDSSGGVVDTGTNNQNDDQTAKYVNPRSNERRKVVMNFLDSNDSVTVKDISKIVPNVSEKTIQRELLSLVSENILRKEGERRWSVYFKN